MFCKETDVLERNSTCGVEQRVELLEPVQTRSFPDLVQAQRQRLLWFKALFVKFFYKTSRKQFVVFYILLEFRFLLKSVHLMTKISLWTSISSEQHKNNDVPDIAHLHPAVTDTSQSNTGSLLAFLMEYTFTTLYTSYIMSAECAVFSVTFSSNAYCGLVLFICSCEALLSL